MISSPIWTRKLSLDTKVQRKLCMTLTLEKRNLMEEVIEGITKMVVSRLDRPSLNTKIIIDLVATDLCLRLK